MADRYDRSVKVPQSTIDEIKKMGMSAAIEKARSGDATPEFREGAKRMYGGNRVGYDKVPKDLGPGVQGPKTFGQGEQAGPAAPTKSPETKLISSTKPNHTAAAARRSRGGRSDYQDAPHRSGGRGRNPTRVLGDLGSTNNPKSIPNTVNRAVSGAAKSVGKALSGGDDKSANEREAEFNRRIESIGGIKSRYDDYKKHGWYDKQLNYMLTDKERGKSERARAAERRRKKS